MGDLKNRLKEIYESYKAQISICENRINVPEFDYDGGEKSVLSLNYRFLSVCEFTLNNDKKKFKELLSNSVSLIATNFQDFDAGKITDTIYVKWNRYFNILDAYASSNPSPGKIIAKYIGNLDLDKKEKGFFPALSYSIKFLVLEDNKNFKSSLAKLADAITQKNAKNYLAYVTILQAYLNEDVKTMQKGFDNLLADHKRLCKGRGEYSNTEDEIIFLHGLGLLNLFRSRGFEVKINDPMIPKELIVK